VPAGVPATAQTAPKTPAPAFQTVFFAGNPTSERYKQVFDKVLEIVGEYFEIEDANRFDGRIQTVPRLGVPAKFLAIDTLGEQSLPAGQERRRRASVQIVAADVGGYFVQVQVPVEAKKVSAAGKESGWSQIGRHTELEQVMLRRLAEQARLTAPAPPPAPAVPLSVPAPAVPLRPPTGAAPAPDPALRPLPVSPLNWERLPPPLPSGPLR